MKKYIYSLLLFCLCNRIYSQIGTAIPIERRVDWTKAGLHYGVALYADEYIDVTTENVGIAPDDAGDDVAGFLVLLAKKIKPESERKDLLTVYYFPPGTYKFNQTISVPSNVVIKGAGSDLTTFKFTSTGNCFDISGQADPSWTVDVLSGAKKGSKTITISNSIDVAPGDYIDLKVYSDYWNYDNSRWNPNNSNSLPQDFVGQIIRVTSVGNNGTVIGIEDELRMDFDYHDFENNSQLTFLYPKIRKNTPVKNVGFEDFEILNENGSEKKIFNFNIAAECWLSGVESEKTVTSHVNITQSTAIEIRECYFHDSFKFGGGGEGYGVSISERSTNCLIEDNVFSTLRHAMIVQLGANGNVYGYNFSYNSRSEDNFSPGDICIHGHWSFANLFESNKVEQITADDWWGKNGYYNTIFRNKITSTTKIELAKDYKFNIIGNSPAEYTNWAAGLNLIDPPSDFSLFWVGEQSHEYSYYKNVAPNFVLGYTWPCLGYDPNGNGLTGRIPAEDRFLSVTAKKTLNAKKFFTVQFISPGTTISYRNKSNPYPSFSSVDYNSPSPIFFEREDRNVDANANNYLLSGIEYIFTGWSKNGGSPEMYPKITENTTLTATFRTQPVQVSNVRIVGRLGQPIQVLWNEHFSTDVIRYRLSRKVKNSLTGVIGPIVELAILPRGTISYIDYQYVSTNGYTNSLIEYNVQAYYDPNHNNGGSYSLPKWISQFGEQAGGVEKLHNSRIFIPKEFSIANFPNPFNPTTTFTFQLPEDAFVNLEIFDLAGRKVSEIIRETREAGVHSITWNVKNNVSVILSSGVYFYRFNAKPVSGKPQYNKIGKILFTK